MIQTSFFPQPEKDKPTQIIQKIDTPGPQPMKVEEIIPDKNILEDTYMIYPTGGYHPFFGVPNTFSRYQLPIWPYIKRIKYNSKNFKNQHQLKSDFGKQHGYPRQTLITSDYKEHRDDNRYDIFMHRIVALAWIPNPDNKPYVMHINDDKTNYLIENLKWGTPSENNKGTSKRPDTMEQKYQNLVDKGIIKG